MSASLVAVFIPILLMGGVVGRLFREFAVTLSAAIAVSLIISLTTTPMMCAKFLRPASEPGSEMDHGRFYRAGERAFNRIHSLYDRSLTWTLRHPPPMLLATVLTICASIYLYIIVPKGFFPDQDTGQLMGGIQADQRISFQAMKQKLEQASAIVQADPAVESIVGFTGGRGTNSANVFVGLKPLGTREPIEKVMARLRPKLAQVPGARLYLFPRQDLKMGGRQSFAQFQYTLVGASSEEVSRWSARLVEKLRNAAVLREVVSEAQDGGLRAFVKVDRDTAGRLGVWGA